MAKSGRLAGTVAIVTGAGSSGPGIGNGKAIALLFGREGASLVLADRDALAVAETDALVRAEGVDDVLAVTADVSLAADCERIAHTALERFGRIDVLVNNVGIGPLGGLLDTDEATWDRAFAVNVKSMVFTCKAVVPAMIANGGGSIVNIASVAALRNSGAPLLAYATTKGAVLAFTRQIALEFAAQQIRANAVVPGLIDTPMARTQMLRGFTAGGDPDELQRVRDAATPRGKQGTPWDVAYAALYLASGESSFVNAEELVVDGGHTMRIAGRPQ